MCVFPYWRYEKCLEGSQIFHPFILFFCIHYTQKKKQKKIETIFFQHLKISCTLDFTSPKVVNSIVHFSSPLRYKLSRFECTTGNKIFFAIFLYINVCVCVCNCDCENRMSTPRTYLVEIQHHQSYLYKSYLCVSVKVKQDIST